jgi:hypothetical protein
MPKTRVVFFQDEDGTVPILDWLDEIPGKAQIKCLARLKRLEQLGHELRRPEADLLRDGIYELRVGLQGINYRILYFFHGNMAAVVSHGLTKERRVPPREIDEAVERKQLFEANPKRHTFEPPQTGG